MLLKQLFRDKNGKTGDALTTTAYRVSKEDNLVKIDKKGLWPTFDSCTIPEGAEETKRITRQTTCILAEGSL
jgi:hypothetical protein